ncbi:MAG TPA: toxin-antitoxin system protein [Thermoanaerobaculia bacterium]|jgi:predicted transcriptional regulator
MPTALKSDRNVRIDAQTDSKLSEIAAETGRAKKEILASAVERERRETILQSMNAGFAALRSNRTVWAEELSERELLDSTLMDGLANE